MSSGKGLSSEWRLEMRAALGGGGVKKVEARFSRGRELEYQTHKFRHYRGKGGRSQSVKFNHYSGKIHWGS